MRLNQAVISRRCMCCAVRLSTYHPRPDQAGIPTVAPICDEPYCRQLVAVPILDLPALEVHPRQRRRRGRRSTNLMSVLMPAA
jgi:hypothetical protein